ncbi:hypothetical protein [Bacillus cereus group sp. Bce015]|uniref:hypothetical protein n=1 Tax=Bacillus cereus group sp. Bce015 TaxID=3445249 RepID=UPI003F28D56D
MSKKIKGLSEESLLKFLEEKGLMESVEELAKKEKEAEENPDLHNVAYMANHLQMLFPEGKWSDQKVRAYIKSGKLKQYVDKDVKIDPARQKRKGYKVHKDDFKEFLYYEALTKDQLKEEHRKLMKGSEKQEEQIRTLKKKIAELEKQLKEKNEQK